ncbi:hypothetical protein C0995_008837 [Termitomyces sp. Mi166|nr:hypothetical protein C0995_008837 [Termitomyces sp. Mi166\
MGELSELVLHFSRGLVARKAAEQGGVISGDNPVTYNASDPFRLWVVQLGALPLDILSFSSLFTTERTVIILAMTQALALVFGRLRQPRVISEVIAGIFLGPSVMGRIPHFKDRIFPDAGNPGLTLTSTIGLIVFLFLVGLEIDTKAIKRHLVAASAISIAGLVVPLGLGAALGVAIYKEFINPDVNYGYFLLFTAVAVGITAFPVLCRILTELKLLETTVGSVTLAAGVGNDVVGWILLALTVALVNAASGLTALYVLLASVGYIIFLLYPVRWAYRWLARWTGSLERGAPTTGMMTLTLVLVFASAFFTDIIGIHAIFGGFVAGLIIPHENGYAISLVEKLEDLVSIVFLPLYFTLSGLKTNLGLMNTGKTWGYTFLICVVAFFAKFVPCFAAAMATGFNWRESGAVGSLMSCKGLVELIVLNIGLQANILDTRSFSMFVVHAVILTFLTTPFTLLFYPEKYRTRDKPKPDHSVEGGVVSHHSSQDETKTRFALVLDRIEQLPAAMTIAHLLQPGGSSSPTARVSSDRSERSFEKPTVTSSSFQISINALRLIELTNRGSAVLKSKVAESLASTDPIISVFRTFGYLNNLLISAALSVVSQDEFPAAVSKHAAETESQMVIVPWSRGSTEVDDESDTRALNPFDGIFHRNTATRDPTSSVVYSEFIRNVFSTSSSNVALFVDRGISTPHSGSGTQRLFLPFIGGPDDRLALSFLVQLARNPSVQATVVRIILTEDLSRNNTNMDKKDLVDTSSPIPIVLQTIAAGDTVYASQDTHTRLASETADNLAWERYASIFPSHDAETAAALSRISFTTLQTSTPLRAIIEYTTKIPQAESARDTIVVAGRSRRMAVEAHAAELQKVITEAGASISSSVPKTLGDVGAALVASNTRASLLVLQATGNAL